MIDDSLLLCLSEYNHYKNLCFQSSINPIIIDDLEKKLKARYNKISRIKKRFLYLLVRYKHLYFCTFTLNDYYINLCDRSRKDLIKNVLHSFDSDIKYIINVDYGKKTERLHYHGIIATNIDYDLNQFLKDHYPCFSFSEKIRINGQDLKRVSKYINKLSNHAIKDSTKGSRVLYNFKGYDLLDNYLKKQIIVIDKNKVGLT